MEPTETGKPTHAKPLLTIDEQIAHLKAKGVMFDLCSEAEATTYLSQKNHFFRTISYRKLFDKHIGGDKDGQYIALDFSQLRFLSDLDRQFRDVMLFMSLDIEHFATTKLLAELSRRDDEDGYSVVADYRASMRASGAPFVDNELRSRKNDEYCGAIIRKYGDDIPLWALLEVVSFGTLIGMIKFCAERWGDPELEELHYQLKRVKSVRNAASHSSCILNDIGDKAKGNIRVPSVVSKELSKMGISKKLRARKMRNARMQQFASLLFLYEKLVPEGGSRKRALEALFRFYETTRDNSDLLPSAHPIRSSIDFMERLTKGFGLLE